MDYTDNLTGMDNFITYKLKVSNIMKEEGCSEDFIKNTITDDEIIFGIVNNIDPKDYAQSLMF